MGSGNKSDLILLSTLIQKLENNNYYRVFAKSLARTVCSADLLPPDNELVQEMFHYFIRENELRINYNGSVVSLDFIESEIQRRASEKVSLDEGLAHVKELERRLIWGKEVYVKVQDLKKLYANKCIVFPKSLLADRDASDV